MGLLFWKKKPVAPQEMKWIRFAGGLGDIANYMWTSDSYNCLDRLESDEQATVVLVCHNPFAKELFQWHPKRSRFSVKDLGFWWPNQDAEMSRKHGIPREQPYVGMLQERCNLYPSPEDLRVLGELRKCAPYIVMSTSAGSVDRNIPSPICEQAVDLAIGLGFKVIQVGRTYGESRSEVKLLGRPGFLNLIDRLSVPGTALALEGAAGIFTCFSASLLFSWHLKRPVFLLYPEAVGGREFHCVSHYTFGKDNPDTRHMAFSGYSRERFIEWLSILKR
jgi:hypothetical protein